MAYTLTLGGYDPSEVGRGPFVPLPVSSLASKAVEAADLTAGNHACTLGSEGKVANLGIAGHLEVLGKVSSISSSTASGNSQDVPSYAMVEFATPGKVFEFVYNSSEAPAMGDRVTLSTDASMAGTVMKAAKVASFDTVYSADTYMFKNVIANYVMDIDTVNTKVKVLFLNGGPVQP